MPRVSGHWCVWVWLSACPLTGAATQFSSRQRRLAIWIRWGQPLSSALDGGDWQFRSAVVLFRPSVLLPRLLLGQRRELSPSVRPVARIHGGHGHDLTPAQRCHQAG